MENAKHELFEVFSVQYGTGKSKGWKVQGEDKVHTRKSKAAAHELSVELEQAAGLEAENQQNEVETDLDDLMLDLDSNIDTDTDDETDEDLDTLFPDDETDTVDESHPQPGMGEADTETDDVPDQTDKKLTAKEVAANIGAGFPREAIKTLKPMVRYFYLMEQKHECPTCGKVKSLRTFADRKTWDINENCMTCDNKEANQVKRDAKKAAQTTEVEVIVAEVIENNTALAAE